jgi:hypothetical protein
LRRSRHSISQAAIRYYFFEIFASAASPPPLTPLSSIFAAHRLSIFFHISLLRFSRFIFAADITLIRR